MRFIIFGGLGVEYDWIESMIRLIKYLVLAE